MHLLQTVNNNLKNPPNYADCPTLWVSKVGYFSMNNKSSEQ